ncbi:MAG TPA: hypothetical protein D7H98_00405 [Candidatus Poseidoniales archaeon]|nr:MAG TPA: hypothetical protein D7H98_00405 [Candidatus Poseidoniales archaeon]|tara:strand:- start:151 stop:1380 length:1230 start_codon:yes stop_codon:yes gene_type:complete
MFSMTNGGLLQKAAQQQTGESNLASESLSSGERGSSKTVQSEGPIRTLGLILGGMVLPFFFVMWFGGTVDFIGENSGYLSAAVLLISAGGIWLFIGKPAPSSGSTIAIGMSFLLLLSSNFAIAILFTGEMSLGEIDLDEDDDMIVVKIRQNGGSGSYEASVSIAYGGASAYASTLDFSIDREDGQGDYGWLKIPVSEFYSGNALPSTDYIMSLEVDGNSWTRTLDANDLTRTLTGVDVSATPSFTTQDCEGAKDQCLRGVALGVSAGLLGASQEYIAPMPLADFDLKVTMTYEGSVAIDYPSVSVEHTVAAWDSSGGVYGSGSAYIGVDGATMSLGGSTQASDVSSTIILKEDWEDAGYGCYEIEIEGSNTSPWSNNIVDHTTYYLYEETNRDDSGQYTSESWVEVSSC